MTALQNGLIVEVNMATAQAHGGENEATALGGSITALQIAKTKAVRTFVSVKLYVRT